MNWYRWTILVATLGRRADKLDHLLRHLLPQTESYGGDVHVLALWNNGERPLGAVRQALVDYADSSYVSFVDDDDEVSLWYVDEVVRALECDPDYVGWQMQCYIDGEASKPTYHSLEYDGWYDDETGYYRDVSHLNPVRRSLALCADFRRGDPPEDVAWADQMRSVLVNASQCYVDKVMYHYRSTSSDSTWRPGSVDPREGSYQRLTVEHPNFSWHPWSFGD